MLELAASIVMICVLGAVFGIGLEIFESLSKGEKDA